MRKSSSSPLLFWGQFFLFHFLLFLPLYFIDRGYSTFWPSSSKEGILQFFFYRDNFDIFRLCFEFTGLVTLLYFLKNRKSWWSRIGFKIFIPVYIFWLVYMIYEAAILSLYGHQPLLLDDLYLLKEVLPIFLTEFSFGNLKDYFLITIGVLVLVFMLVFWLKYFLKTLKNLETSLTTSLGKFNSIVLGIVWIFMIANTVYTINMYQRGLYECTMWLTKKARRHLAHGMTIWKNGTPALIGSQKDYEVYTDYLTKKLDFRPDIYLLFIESYGRLLYTNPNLSDSHLNYISQKEKALKARGWNSVSTFSQAQNTGGKSWYSYTSLMAGLGIHTQLEYRSLLSAHSEYPHLVRFLKSNGYQTFRLNTMPDKKTKNMIPYADYDRYYAFDHWIKNENLPFNGYEFELFSSMPDQFALNYYHEEVEKDTTQPEFLFFISLNSHVPWASIIPFHPDWRQLDSLSHEIAKSHEQENLITGLQTDKYARAIEYQLDYISDFILNQVDSNSLVIVVGDHQPPMITNLRDGVDVPLHVISRDQDLLDAFIPYGFDQGMIVQKEGKASMRHEGFYSLFVKVLLERYGKEGVVVPEYLERGISR